MNAIDDEPVGRLKITILGGGGLRVPTVVEALDAATTAIGLDEIVLYDVDEERLARMELVVQGMRETTGSGRVAELRSTTRLADAVDGAWAVLAAIRVGAGEARVVDEEVPLALGVLGQETVGPAGIVFAIRTIPVMREIARVVATGAPTAWFVNFTNPAGIVTQAIRPILGDRVVGICDSPSALWARIAWARELGMQDLVVDYAGLNHLGWVVGVREFGREVLAELLADDERLRTIVEVRLLGIDEVRRLGAIPNEYLVYFRKTEEIVASLREAGPRGAVVRTQTDEFFGTPIETPKDALLAWRRSIARRYGTYLAEAHSPAEDSEQDPIDEEDGQPGIEHAVFSYGSVATAFLRAVMSPHPTPHVLDVANDGRLPFVDRDDVIEATCEVSADGITLAPGPALPDEAARLVARVKEVERLTIQAANEGRAELALAAIATHPLVPSREVAERILSGYLARDVALRGILR